MTTFKSGWKKGQKQRYGEMTEGNGAILLCAVTEAYRRQEIRFL